MTESSTICIGSELFAVLADLRARGCDVWSLDAAVGGKNSQYRVSFSERVTEESLSVSGRNRNAGHAGPAALTNFSGATSVLETEPRDNRRMAATVAKGTARKPVYVNASANDRRDNSGNEVGRDSRRDGTPSLETRLQNLYAKAVKSGRVRTRFKTTTQVEHARKPYAD